MTDAELDAILAQDTRGGKPIVLPPDEYARLAGKPELHPLGRYIELMGSMMFLRGAPITVESRWRA